MKLHFNITGIVMNILSTLFEIFWRISIPFFLVIGIILLLIVYWFFYFRVIEKITMKHRDYRAPKKDSIFRKIFYKFPKQLAYDIITQDPEEFNEFGIHMFCGSQGSGKTIAAIQMIRSWQLNYPLLEVYTNIYYKYATGKIEKWQDLILHNNGVYGVVNFYDEVHTSFSSEDSRKVPPALLSEVSYQRKQKKALVMTSQVFGRVAKPLREQVDFLYLPKTYLKCFTIVWKVDPLSYDSATNKFRTRKGFYFFVHDRELREMYDTFEKVMMYANTEFGPSIYAGTSPSVTGETSE